MRSSAPVAAGGALPGAAPRAVPRPRAGRESRRRSPSASARTSSERLELEAAAGRAGCRARAAPSTPAARRRSGLTTPWKLCTRPSALTKVPAVSVNGAIGSSTSARSSPAPAGTASATTTISALRERGAARRAGSAASSVGLDVQQQAGLERRVGAEHAARRRRRRSPGRGADELGADRVGRRRPASRSVAPVCSAIQRPSRSSSAGVGMLRGGVAEQDRLARRRCASAAAIALRVVGVALPAAGAATPLAAADRGGDVGQRLRPAARRARRGSGPSASASRRAAACTLMTLRALLRRLAQALGEERMVLAQEGADDQHALQLGQRRDRLAEPADRRRRARPERLRAAGCRRCSLPRPRTSSGEEVQLLDGAGRRGQRADALRRRARRRSASGRARRSRAPRSSRPPATRRPGGPSARVRRSSRVERLVREAVAVGEPALVDVLVLERQRRASPARP